jgi:hypothetical protein
VTAPFIDEKKTRWKPNISGHQQTYSQPMSNGPYFQIQFILENLFYISSCHKVLYRNPAYNPKQQAMQM